MLFQIKIVMKGCGKPEQQLQDARSSIARYRDEFVDLYRTFTRSTGRVSITDVSAVCSMCYDLPCCFWYIHMYTYEFTF